MVEIYDPIALGLTVGHITRDEAWVVCPFHNDKRPTNASLNLVTGKFYCFACGERSDAETIAVELDGEVVKVESSSIVRSDEKPEREWTHMFSASLALGNKYLASRGVSDALVAKFGILQFPDGIIFPMKNPSGMVVGTLVRHYELKPKYMFYGKRPPLWPYSNLEPSSADETLYIVEGVFGVLRAASAGLKAVAIMGASAFSSGLDAFISAKNAREGRCLAMTDPDLAGCVAGAKLVMHGFRVLIPPVEPDEITKIEWQFINAEWPNGTTDWKALVRWSGDVRSFWRATRNYDARLEREKRWKRK